MTNSSDPVVSVRGLRKAYSGFTVVDDIDFEIAPGETFALLGPNGAGKSTTIEILAGYRDRTAGDVRVLGVDPQHATRGWKAQLGIVLQSTGEPGVMTVAEQLRHFARFYPRPRDVDETIAAVGLTDKAGARLAKLSGGQRRRVDVALGIIGNPRLLFLDEPTTGFDPEARHEFWELIRTLKRDGTSILLTTHYLDEAARLGDRAGVIAAGRMVDIGAIHELGGADARTPLVRWRDDRGQHEVRTREPGRTVADIVADLGSEPDDLEVVRPSLEDVYLGLLGTARDLEEVAA
ncbi:ABC transporter ATP-binding protein [Planctomonas sp. JC2975]|uniref:ABC transporter ATP-binding protein n=1 Tax=Planctomonas sp. JC2975 TaxID=2729626 RepID=UPI0014734746|nr:ABC transporter ATP-binding protein [Planctomonas sp. JC2975]NNC13386.1 ABC transporter ATP-binding protein [Planctomonas sp. JC2975]